MYLAWWEALPTLPDSCIFTGRVWQRSPLWDPFSSSKDPILNTINIQSLLRFAVHDLPSNIIEACTEERDAATERAAEEYRKHSYTKGTQFIRN